MRKRAASDPALRAAWAAHPVVPSAPPEPDESDDAAGADDVVNVIGREPSSAQFTEFGSAESEKTTSTR